MKRGYAVSGMLYTILVLFMALLLSFLYTMQNKKNILDKLKTEVVEAFYCSKADNIEDLRGATVIATAVTQEGDNALIQLPKEGRYDTTSYLSVPMSKISNGANRTYIIKDGIVQSNYSLVYSSAFTAPTFENGYIDTHGNRAVGFDSVDVTNYSKLFIDFYAPNTVAASAGIFVNNSYSVNSQQAYTRSYFQSYLKGNFYDLSSCSGNYNLAFSTGSSSETYKYYIYNMWLE